MHFAIMNVRHVSRGASSVVHLNLVLAWSVKPIASRILYIMNWPNGNDLCAQSMGIG